MTRNNSPVDRALLGRLYDQSGAARWALSREAFAAALEASAAHGLAGRSPSRDETERYLAGLRLEDLALAAACSAGLEPAWEHFIATHRPSLQRAAGAIDPTGAASEIADSLFADLYGLDVKQGARRSLFRYFHGRSSLATWLRAVLSQRHIDRIRTTKRLEPLPDDPGSVAAPDAGPPDTERTRFQSAMQASCAVAIAALPARDRLRLSLYYVDDMTLAAIGRVLKEHEATVSRQLSRTRVAIRDAVDARLRADHGMDDAAIAECFRTVIDDAGALDLRQLTGRPRKNAPADRSNR